MRNTREIPIEISKEEFKKIGSNGIEKTYGVLLKNNSYVDRKSC
jgi:hypothetical protein